MFFVCCPIIPSVCETKPGISSGSSNAALICFRKTFGDKFLIFMQLPIDMTGQCQHNMVGVD